MLVLTRSLAVGAKGKSLMAFAGCCLSVSACQADYSVKGSDFLTVVTTDNLVLALEDRQGKCAIRLAKSQEVTELDVPYPCGFIRSGEKPVAQTYSYEDIGRVFVVAGPLADEKAYTKDSGVNPGHKCSNSGQAIIIKDNGLITRQAQKIPLGFCHQLGFDEKDFYGFAYPVN